MQKPAYRTMVFFAPVAAVVLICSRSSAEDKQPPGAKLLRLAVLGISFVAGCVAIFGWAYTHMGVDRADMLNRFLRQDDAQAYFDPSARQWLKLPLGLVRNCFPVVASYNGMRGFLHGSKSTLIPAIALVGALWFCLLYCGYTLAKRRAALTPAERAAVFAALTGLLFTMVPLLTWDPHYGKFWIQPLACLAVLVAVAYRQFEGESRRIVVAGQVAGVLFLFGVAFNLTWALRNRSHDAFEFEEARKVTQFIGDKDFVVLDRGADSVSVMYAYLYADERQIFPFMDKATILGSGAVNQVDQAIRRTQAAGGKVYFLGLIDIPKSTWDAFLGRRCGVPYDEFDRYRSALRLKAHFKSRTGPTYLWELELPAQAGNQRPPSAPQPNS